MPRRFVFRDPVYGAPASRHGRYFIWRLALADVSHPPSLAACDSHAGDDIQANIKD